MKKLILAATMIGSIVVASPLLIESSLKDTHPELSVSPLGETSMCGIKVGYKYDGEAIVSQLKKQYNIQSFHQQESDYLRDEYYDIQDRVRPYPDEISDYFASDTLPENLMDRDWQIKKSIKLYKSMEIDASRKEQQLQVREKSNLTFDEAKAIHLEWNKDYKAEENAIHKRAKDAFIGQYQIASCLYQNDDYLSYLNSGSDKISKIEEELVKENIGKIKEEMKAELSKALINAGIEFDEIEFRRGYEEAVIYLDNHTVARSYIRYGLYQSIYKAFAFTRLSYINDKKGKVYVPNVYLFNK